MTLRPRVLVQREDPRVERPHASVDLSIIVIAFNEAELGLAVFVLSAWAPPVCHRGRGTVAASVSTKDCVQRLRQQRDGRGAMRLCRFASL